jgi:hypothetical protein
VQPTSWKTTLVGILGALCIIGSDLAQHKPLTQSDIFAALSVAGVGIFAKDHSSGAQ